MARKLADPTSTSWSLRQFMRAEAAGGAALVTAAVIALIWANSPWSASYDDVWSRSTDIDLLGLHLPHDVRHWINDGLMTLFFFVAGVEIKRELVLGELNSVRRAMLPAFGALGGMVVPALIYLALNPGPDARGWGIPMATDIAFAVGVLALLGSRVPSGLKIFVLSLAIVDDIGAILVIALSYSAGVDVIWLMTAIVFLLIVAVLSRRGLRWIPLYMGLGVLVWLATLASGVHATIAGVALGLLVPARPDDPGDVETSVAQRIENRLHPWTSLMVVPLFALANAGLDLGILRTGFGSRVTLGVVGGLVVGKTLGITLLTWIAVRTKAGILPTGVGWRHLVGGAAVAGIGFTVSLFITSLAFTSAEPTAQAKLGVFAGSLLAGVIGAVLLMTTPSGSDGTSGTPAR